MVCFQFAAEGDQQVLNVASHGIFGLVLVAERFAAHEPGGYVDKKLEVAVFERKMG